MHGVMMVSMYFKSLNYKRNMAETTLSLGEQRVRTEFNPSKGEAVDLLKQKTAELINICEHLGVIGHDRRLVALAQTAYEEAAMWAVKAATS